MEKRTLGRTGLRLPIVSFGASTLGQEFRKVTLDEALRSVQVALDCGLNFIDTSPFYGRGMSEVLLGMALRDVPRDSYTLCTKLGRYDLRHFDFSAKLALQFSIANPDITTTIAGSANPDNIRKWAYWATEPIEQQLLAEVLEIFRPVKNIGHAEGLPKNN